MLEARDKGRARDKARGYIEIRLGIMLGARDSLGARDKARDNARG